MPLPSVERYGRSTIRGKGSQGNNGHAGLKMPVSLTFSAHRKAQQSRRSDENAEPLVVCKVQIVLQAVGGNEITHKKVS